MEELVVRYTFSFLVSFALWVLISWGLMIMAVLIDLWSGTVKSKALGSKVESKGLRMTITKIGDYWRLQVFGLMIDVFLSIWVDYPFGTFLVTVACIVIEVKSVIENYKSKSSSAADVVKVMSALKDLKDSDLSAIKSYLNVNSESKDSGASSSEG